MTRIEKIRQMTDEELAEFLSEVDTADKLRTCPGSACRPPNPEDGVDDPCAVCMLHWLREEGEVIDRRHR